MKRRDFLKQSGALGAGFWIAGRQVGFGQEKSANAKLNVGHIGVAGMRGADHLGQMSSQHQIALCDVDEKNLAAGAAKLPNAAKYHDFREMLEKEKSLDCIVISTPDHIHAAAAVMAMKLGKHVYTEKPMAHTVHEVRVMTETARERKVQTQMGTQIHAGDNYRRVVELIQGGAIGKVSEVHVWLAGSRWTGTGLPKEEPAPAGLHWDLWLGPSEERPYSARYHPIKWRCYWNFGGGDLADMGCHFIDLPFWALKLGHCLTAEAEGPATDVHGAPVWLTAHWTFPARGEMPPVKLTWYHGEKSPPQATDGTLGDWKGPGVLFLGEKGMLVSNYGAHKLLPEADFKEFKRPEPTIAKSLGHHQEWVAAIKGAAERPLCNFDYAGPLSETVLLGNVAYKVGKKIEWDAASMKAKGCPEADRYLRKEYRKGWTL